MKGRIAELNQQLADATQAHIDWKARCIKAETNLSMAKTELADATRVPEDVEAIAKELERLSGDGPEEKCYDYYGMQRMVVNIFVGKLRSLASQVRSLRPQPDRRAFWPVPPGWGPASFASHLKSIADGKYPQFKELEGGAVRWLASQLESRQHLPEPVVDLERCPACGGSVAKAHGLYMECQAADCFYNANIADHPRICRAMAEASNG